MTFAVVGVLSNMSKTLLLFFIPQIFNFLLSCPQIFGIINCPRHRLPQYNEKDDLRYNSWTDKFKITSPANLKQHLAYWIVKVLSIFNIIRIENLEDDFIRITNMTLINVVINFTGPMHEKSLTYLLMGLQVCCSIVAFLIRYKLASFCY